MYLCYFILITILHIHLLMNGALSIVRTNTDQIMESFIAVFRNCTAWFCLLPYDTPGWIVVGWYKAFIALNYRKKKFYCEECNFQIVNRHIFALISQIKYTSIHAAINTKCFMERTGSWRKHYTVINLCISKCIIL